MDHAGFVAVLQILADTRKIDFDLNTVMFEIGTRPNAREHEQLRSVECSTS